MGLATWPVRQVTPAVAQPGPSARSARSSRSSSGGIASDESARRRMPWARQTGSWRLSRVAARRAPGAAIVVAMARMTSDCNSRLKRWRPCGPPVSAPSDPMPKPSCPSPRPPSSRMPATAHSSSSAAPASRVHPPSAVTPMVARTLA